MVEGIHTIEETAIANRSALLKPSEFDTKKYAAKWAIAGASADAARLPHRILPGYLVDGWQVWKYPEGHDEAGKPCTRPLGGKQAILLFRPANLQRAVNAIYGNLSKERTIAEQQGKTVEGKQVPTGILPGTHFAGKDPAGDEEAKPIGFSFNRIPALPSANAGARGKEVRSTTAGRRRTTTKTT